ncbi:MAG TPA: extracellular solute-binding protein [Actinoplanes sp.]|jgi:iron(III) transport system substrate-binding protein|nr:extracellular solute-binding protein [Actinoplanes sp.]
MIATTDPMPRRIPTYVVLVLLFALVGACSTSTAKPGADGTTPPRLTLYTSVTQNTVDAVVTGFTAAHPGAKVDVYRATTGALNARLAAEQRSGGVRADVIWGTDPLSMQSYAEQKLLRAWPLPDATGVPADARTAYFWGTRILYVVMVTRNDLSPVPTGWADLTDPAYRNAVALPDPAAAGSAFAAVGYFSQAPGFGMDFYRTLKRNGAVQVSTVPEVVTSVAQGRYRLGITLDSEVRTAVAHGSPVRAVWPKEGAIALYSPIAETAAARNAAAAQSFLAYVLSTDGQRRIGASGWQPIVPDVPGPPRPAGATSVSPDWTALFGRQREILRQYQAIFGPA